ncbi:unnamed protein product [Pleuronectes platessa]|uniref:Uncharacterized protein n=1 Tax=Pleuronectes platessa TaxID=8262 RepID=A0A9N7Z9V1_PLEPL|nr:unnamed protein product [Pleuronectes platessa]
MKGTRPRREAGCDITDTGSRVARERERGGERERERERERENRKLEILHSIFIITIIFIIILIIICIIHLLLLLLLIIILIITSSSSSYSSSLILEFLIIILILNNAIIIFIIKIIILHLLIITTNHPRHPPPHCPPPPPPQLCAVVVDTETLITGVSVIVSSRRDASPRPPVECNLARHRLHSLSRRRDIDPLDSNQRPRSSAGDTIHPEVRILKQHPPRLNILLPQGVCPVAS